jgi:hypothetical protein
MFILLGIGTYHHDDEAWELPVLNCIIYNIYLVSLVNFVLWPLDVSS